MSLADRLKEERRARLAAERLLELKQAELSAANRKLGRHALALTRQIGATQAEVATVRDENAKVKSDLSTANEKVERAERRLWHSIQAFQDGFAFFDADSKLIGANTAYLDLFDGLENDAETRQLLTASLASELTAELHDRGVRHFHLYTLNRADLAFAVSRVLGLHHRMNEGTLS